MHTLGESLEKIRIGETTKGKSIFAVDFIPKGTVITTVHGEHLSFEDTTKLNRNESFCVQIDRDAYVLPSPPFYLINHSCSPNCGLNEKLELFALRDIDKNEELNWDYSTSMLERHWTMKCNCNSPECRGSVTDFDLLPKEVQEKYLRLKIVLPYIVSYLGETQANARPQH